MKLLDKKTITTQKSAERKLEIDEGAKLARKIDTLRETAAGEESRLAKFRDESLKRIKEEINLLIGQRDSIQEEIDVLELQKKYLQEPLDQAWNIVKAKETDLTQYGEQLRETKANLDLEITKLEKEKSDLEIEKWRVKDERDRAVKNLEETEKNKENSRIILKNSEAKANNVDAELEVKQKHLLKRELELLAQERDLQIGRDFVAKRKKKLDDRERFINDKYETLLRSQERLKK